MRAFIGIEIDEDLRGALDAACSTIRETSPPWIDQKWVPAQNLHITLKFFGDISVDAAETLAIDLADALKDISTFVLPVDRFVAAVPGTKTARMLWTTFSDPNDYCTDLASRVEDMSARYSVLPDSRSFTPHITLCRARRPRSFSAEEIACETATAFLYTQNITKPSVSVQTVTVFKSVLTRNRPFYERVSTVRLAD